MQDALPPSSSSPALAPAYTVKCGRCTVIFAVSQWAKLEHFSIYRVNCPHCGWPGRYLASELHAGPVRPAARPKAPRRTKVEPPVALAS